MVFIISILPPKSATISWSFRITDCWEFGLEVFGKEHLRYWSRLMYLIACVLMFFSWDLRWAIVANVVACVAPNVMCISVVVQLCHWILDMHASDWLCKYRGNGSDQNVPDGSFISAIFLILISFNFLILRNICISVPMLVGFMNVKFEIGHQSALWNVSEGLPESWSVCLMRRVRYVISINYDVPTKVVLYSILVCSLDLTPWFVRLCDHVHDSIASLKLGESSCLELLHLCHGVLIYCCILFSYSKVSHPLFSLVY